MTLLKTSLLKRIITPIDTQIKMSTNGVTFDTQPVKVNGILHLVLVNNSPDKGIIQLNFREFSGFAEKSTCTYGKFKGENLLLNFRTVRNFLNEESKKLEMKLDTIEHIKACITIPDTVTIGPLVKQGVHKDAYITSATPVYKKIRETAYELKGIDISNGSIIPLLYFDNTNSSCDPDNPNDWYFNKIRVATFN